MSECLNVGAFSSSSSGSGVTEGASVPTSLSAGAFSAPGVFVGVAAPSALDSDRLDLL